MGTKRIFFCGEIVADMIEREEGSGNFSFLLGGSHYNSVMGVRKAARREDQDYHVGFVGPISQDMFGSRMYHSMESVGADMSGIKRVENNTTMAVISIRPGKENGFVFYNQGTAEQQTRIEDLPAVLGNPGDSKVLCFGSISTVMEPARFAWLEFARRHQNDSLICYDLNARPTIAKDPARYREILKEWSGLAHVMKASDADIAWAYPDMSMPDIAKLWLDAGASLVVFTKGLHGSEAYTKQVRAEASTLDLVAVNTVGAGDNFNAGLAMALSKRDLVTPAALEKLAASDLEAILRSANETAAYHLISIGARPRDLSCG